MCGDKDYISVHFIQVGPLNGTKKSENLAE